MKFTHLQSQTTPAQYQLKYKVSRELAKKMPG